MPLEWTNSKGWHVGRFRGMTLDEVDEESRAVAAYVDALPEASQVALSFDGVDWVSSNVISLILRAKDAVARRHGTFVIASLCDRLREALQIAHLDRVLNIKPSVDDLA